MGTEGSFPGAELAEAWNWPPPSDKFRNA
jgi:hypothetical protein